MALPYRQRMEREISRLEVARARLVHRSRRGPGDVRVGKGEYVAGAELDRYQRLGRELEAVRLRLDDGVGVSGWPSGAERPGLLDRALVERDHLEAIPRRDRTPGQRHALSVARRRVDELGAAAGAAARGGAAAAAGDPPETPPGRSGARTGPGHDVQPDAGKAQRADKNDLVVLGRRRHLSPDQHSPATEDGDDPVAGPPSTVELPGLLQAAIAERDQLAAIPRTARTAAQTHALWLADCRVSELEAAGTGSGPRRAGEPARGGDRRGARAAAAVSAARDAADVDDQVAEPDFDDEGWGPWRIGGTHPDRARGDGCQPTVEERYCQVDDPGRTPHLDTGAPACAATGAAPST